MQKWILWLAAALLMMSAAACTQSSDAPEEPAAEEATEAPADMEEEAEEPAEAPDEAESDMASEDAAGGSEMDSPIGVTWAWQETVSEGDAAVTVDDPSRYTLTLNEDGSASVQADCNQMQLSYTV